MARPARPATAEDEPEYVPEYEPEFGDVLDRLDGEAFVVGDLDGDVAADDVADEAAGAAVAGVLPVCGPPAPVAAM